MRQAVGIDVGGSTLRAALVDESGRVVASVKELLRERDPQSVVALAAELLTRITPAQTTLPIGVGVAAQLWVHEGRVAVAPNLGWRDVPYGAMLRARFGRPVRLVNDLDAITAGEAAAGAARGERDVLCIFLGTGLGMGAIVQGQLIEGADGLATELGHIKIEAIDTGRLCGCGQRGCLEAYTSGRHLPALFVEKLAAGLESPLADQAHADPTSLTADVLERAVVAGDAAATALWIEIGERLARALGNVVALLNPRVLGRGGGVLFAAPTLPRHIRWRLGA